MLEKQLYRYSSKDSTGDTLEEEIAEVSKTEFEFRSEWATLSLVEPSRTDSGCGIGPFGAAPPLLLSLSPRNHELIS